MGRSSPLIGRWILFTILLVVSGMAALALTVWQVTELAVLIVLTSTGALVLSSGGMTVNTAVWLATLLGVHFLLERSLPVDWQPSLILPLVVAGLFIGQAHAATLSLLGSAGVVSAAFHGPRSTAVSVVILLVVVALALKYTRRSHSLVLLASIPIITQISPLDVQLLLSSMAAGLIAVFRKEGPWCPFRLERGLLASGSLIAAFSLLVIAAGSYPSFGNYLPVGLARIIWVYGYMLQLAGILTPRPAEE